MIRIVYINVCMNVAISLEQSGFLIMAYFETISISNSHLTAVQNLAELPKPKENTCENIDREQPELQARVYTILKWVVAFLLFAGMLLCLVFNQMTLAKAVSLLNKVGEDGNFPNRVKGFIILMLIILVPNLFNLLRCYLVGTFAKNATSYPWPNTVSLTIGIIVTVLEMLCISEILFFSGPYLAPDVFILILAGTFSATILLQLCYTVRNGEGREISWVCVGKNVLLFLSFTVHTLAIIGIPFLLIMGIGTEGIQISAYLLLIFSLVVLSVLWSPNIQNLTIQPHLTLGTMKEAFLLKFVGTVRGPELEKGVQANARWKGGLIYSFVRVFAFSVLGPLIFILHNLDDIDKIFTLKDFSFEGSLIFVLAVNIIFSLVAYVISYIACSIRSQKFGFFFPLIISTPFTLFIMQYWKDNGTNKVWPHIQHTLLFNHTFLDSEGSSISYTIINVSIVLLGILLLATQLPYTYRFFKNSRVVMATDDLLFHLPTYNPIFLTQYALLNRRVESTMVNRIDGPFADPGGYDNAHIFICSTMYHESEEEMKNLLLSIKALADANKNGFLKQTFESHIFFDGANQGRDLTMYAMRLISLLEECFDVKLAEGQKRYTPYGMQLAWVVSEHLRFIIHCKNGNKVKNKKRWSQVMYMYYILFFRIPNDNKPNEEDPEKGHIDHYERTFILTTDADIVFTPESVKSLIEMLSRDRTVGAVCARTHPLGSGPIVWYQVFDYAIGHWFQKVAENVMGSVLCCPGCFSLFRTSALKDVVQIYASNVSLAKDFLTKDMGEDRWLCTLLVQHGWRLEYCAVSENFTFCPDHFEEFYKQRRRWVPSTLANLFELVSSGSRIVKKNNFISYLFIFYQILNIVSTILSPGAVIIVLVGGLSVSLGFNQYIMLVIQLLIAGIFMLICLYTSQKTQLNTAKILTGVYAFMMTAVVIGLIGQGAVAVTETINAYYFNKNVTDFENKILKGTLTSFTTFYLLFLSIIYTIAAILHPFEAYQVLNFVWYIICLPSGYLLLIIYSFCNLTDRSWGTREATVKSETKSLVHYLKLGRDYLIQCWIKCNKRVLDEKVEPPEAVNEKPETVQKPPQVIPREEVRQKGHRYTIIDTPNALQVSIHPTHRNHLSIEQFLDRMGMGEYLDYFLENGYDNLALIAKLNKADLNKIGIVKRGHELKILKGIKEIYVFEADIQSYIPNGIYDWLNMLSLPTSYAGIMQQEGYGFKNEMENLVGMKEEELLGMGITKRGHIQRFKEGIKKLEYPTNEDLLYRERHECLIKMKEMDPKEFEAEDTFWLQMKLQILKVDNSIFHVKQEGKLKAGLEELRNNYLLLLIVANSIWLLAFFLLDSPQFRYLRIENTINVIGMIFVVIYGSIYFIQFVCLMLHRVYTLMHFVADAEYFRKRVKPEMRRRGSTKTTTTATIERKEMGSNLSFSSKLFTPQECMTEALPSDRTPLLKQNRGATTGELPIEQSSVSETKSL